MIVFFYEFNEFYSQTMDSNTSALDLTDDLLKSFKEYSLSESDNSICATTTASVLSTPIQATVDSVMGHKAQFKESFASCSAFAHILNDQPNAQVQVPTDRRSLKKLTKMRYDREYVLFCSRCNELCNEGFCEKCKIITKKKKSNFVVKIKIEQQIQYSLQKNFDAIIQYLNRPKNNSIISDIDDSDYYAKIASENPDSIVLSFTLNADGAEVYKSKRSSLWPIQLYQNFLPPNIRYKTENILVYMLYFGKQKPDMTKLLPSLGEEIEMLQTNQIKFFLGGNLYKFLPVVMFLSADLGAISMFSGLKTYAGRKACTACLHPGKQITDHLGTKYIRYVKLDINAEPRSHAGVVSAAVKFNKNSPEEPYGLISIPPMILFPKFDLKKGFVIDYMHNILLGIMKLLLDFWMGEHRLCQKSEYFRPMSKRNRDLLDKRLLALRPYEHITRKPRPLSERSIFKAVEYRHLLIYYLPFALRGLLDDEKLHHFQLLSASIYILLKSQITNREITEAADKLTRFADLFEKIYGEESVTMNVHKLRHYGELVKECGPIWSYSMFGFETNNGVLTKTVTNATDTLETMSFHYCMETKNEVRGSDNVKMLRPKEIELTAFEISIIQDYNINLSENGTYKVSDSIKYKDQTFKSKKSAKTKCIDHFVELHNSEIGCIHRFIQLNGNIAFIFEEFETIEHHDHLIRAKTTNKLKICFYSEITCKLLYMKFGCYEILTKAPNHYESN